MSRKMLIDASHPEETRVVVVDNNRVEDFDFESATKKQIRGNIYLAKVTRVEPSLQAAFVEYGGNKHGFLAFNEIHPDYYQIPFEDRQALREAEAKLERETEAELEAEDDAGEAGGDDDDFAEESARKRRNLLRKYKIQEVIKRRQVLLVQVAKEERGNKGAALTTYLSLAGRYCVLMPNTARGGGISRKITQASDRKRLKSAVQSLDVPKGMGLIIRTAGASRTKVEIKRDYDYLIRLWETIRELTLKSTAPTLIYEEGNLVKRAIRDLYDKEIEQVHVEGEEAYKEAKAFMRMLMPSHAAKVQNYKEDTPLFLRHQVESQLEAVYSPVSQLRSGGYLVINPTEALVSIDVNSGRATKERNIEQTALKTNLEAAEEAARQMRLRDLAGLLVIDFIDMDESKNVRAVEKKMKDALSKDRARIQMGRISQFGLMELSRQRRRASLVEGSTQPCPHCEGMGYVRSVESSALAALRALEEEGLKGRSARVILFAPPEVALYILNEKREHLRMVEERFALNAVVSGDPELKRGGSRVERLETRSEAERAAIEASRDRPVVPEAITAEDEADIAAAAAEAEADTGGEADGGDTGDSSADEGREGGSRRRKRRRRGGRGGDDAAEARSEDSSENDNASAEEDGDGEDREDGGRPEAAGEDDEDGRGRKRRRRGRRGGRGRRRRGDEAAEGSDRGKDGGEASAQDSGQGDDALTVVEPAEGEDLGSKETPPKRARPARRRKAEDAETQPAAMEEAADAAAGIAAEEPHAEAEKPKRRRRKKAEPETAEAPVAPEAEAAPEAEEKPKRRRRRKAEPEDGTEAPAPEASAEPAAEEKPKRRTRSRAKPKPEAEAPAEAPALEAAARAPEPEPEPAPEPQSEAAEPEAEKPEEDGKPKRRGWWQRSKLLGS